MKFIVLPIVYIFTLGLFPLFLYWYPNLYISLMFDQISEKSFENLINAVKLKQEKMEEESQS